MNTEEKNKALLLNLIDKYLKGNTNAEENQYLINYFESFQTTNSWNDAIGDKEVLRKEMLLKLQKALKDDTLIIDDSNPVIELKQQTKKKPIWKYAIAASVALFISIAFLINKGNNNLKKPTPTIVNNNIKIGTDKATLTLEDGSTVALEKGQQYISNNLESNGEAIVYKTPSSKKTEIAYNYLTIPRGGQYHIKLSDGSQVWLNSESQIKYPINFVKGKPRQVELVYGEAYFDVSPSTTNNGSSFMVQSNGQNIEVIGTEFNVKAYKDEFDTYTTLVEGKIALNTANNNKILKPNEQAVLNSRDEILTVNNVDVYNEISWRKGIFSFKNKSLKEIMKVLSRWYNIDIRLENTQLENIKFNGVLSKKQNIENILLTIKATNNFDYKINKNEIVIK